MSKAQTKATNKYQAKNYDQLKVLVKKGMKDKIKTFAEEQGKSLNAYINDLIKEDMKNKGIVYNDEKSGDQSEDKGIK